MQNISSPEQLKGLTRDLQDAAGGGLIIGIDQEGGQVCRLKPAAGFPPQPGAKEVATAGLVASRAAAERCAALLADCGITCNFALAFAVWTMAAISVSSPRHASEKDDVAFFSARRLGLRPFAIRLIWVGVGTDPDDTPGLPGKYRK